MNNLELALQRAKSLEKNILMNAVHSLVKNNAHTDPVKTVLIKPVGDFCNLRCTYCYEGRHTKQKPLELSSIRKLYKSIAERNNYRFKFAWHGGEPLLAGIGYFDKALSLQNKILDRKAITNIIQTSGYLIDLDWIQLFKEHNVHVGISLDGTKENHDRFRITAMGRGTFDRVRKSIDMMLNENVEFGVITVIGSENPRRLLQLCEDLSIKNIDVHPRNSSGMNGLLDESATTAKELQAYLIELFDAWRDSTYPLEISVFEQFFRHREGHHPSTCHFNGRCSDIIALEPNGDILPCTRPFAGEFATLGNLANYDFNLDKYEASSQYSYFVERDSISKAGNYNCKWSGICNNGCPQHREKDGVQDVSGGDVYCNCSNGGRGGYYFLWDHIESCVEEYTN